MLVDSFLKYLRLELNRSEKTVVSYGTDLRNFEGYLKDVEAEIGFTTVHADHVRNWIVFLMDKGCAVASINRKLSSLRSFYRFLVMKKEIVINPMRKVSGLKTRKKLPVFVREKDMNRLLDELSVDESFEGSRDRMILEVFYVTGIRLSELIGLNDADVDFFARQIKVTGKRDKQRIIPFGRELEEDLRMYVEIRNEAVPEHMGAFFVRKNGKRMYPMEVYRLV